MKGKKDSSGIPIIFFSRESIEQINGFKKKNIIFFRTYLIYATQKPLPTNPSEIADIQLQYSCHGHLKNVKTVKVHYTFM